jgi:predicted RNA-binding protein (virulence factor B family)
MNKNIKVGELNLLKINRVSEPGLYLISEDEQEVLLPNCYVKKEMSIGSIIEVFIYTDSEDRLVATTLKPYGMKNDFVCLEVVDSTKFGAFLDMGLPKDLLVPKNKQRSTFNVGSRKVVQIVEDEKTNRLIGTEKFTLTKEVNNNFSKNDEVDILLYIKTPLGFKVIVNNTYEGLIYHNEIFENIKIGDRKKGYIKYIRDDGKIDISLQKIGAKKDDDFSQKVVDILNQNNGELAFTYKSDAEDIKEIFGMSKKAFKSALTSLINDKKIILEENCIKLVN